MDLADARGSLITGISLCRDVVRKHKKASFALGASLVLWLVFFVLIYWFDLAEKWRSFLELFNGATWPSDWQIFQKSNPALFAASLASRTIVNFAGPLGGIAATIWFLFDGLERYMEMSLKELVRMENIELVSRLIEVLRQRHPDVIQSEDVEVMHSEAKKFLAEWQSELRRFG